MRDDPPRFGSKRKQTLLRIGRKSIPDSNELAIRCLLCGGLVIASVAEKNKVDRKYTRES